MQTLLSVIRANPGIWHLCTLLLVIHANPGIGLRASGTQVIDAVAGEIGPHRTAIKLQQGVTFSDLVCPDGLYLSHTIPEGLLALVTCVISNTSCMTNAAHMSGAPCCHKRIGPPVLSHVWSGRQNLALSCMVCSTPVPWFHALHVGSFTYRRLAKAFRLQSASTLGSFGRALRREGSVLCVVTLPLHWGFNLSAVLGLKGIKNIGRTCRSQNSLQQCMLSESTFRFRKCEECRTLYRCGTERGCIDHHDGGSR